MVTSRSVFLLLLDRIKCLSSVVEVIESKRSFSSQDLSHFHQVFSGNDAHFLIGLIFYQYGIQIMKEIQFYNINPLSFCYF